MEKEEEAALQAMLNISMNKPNVARMYDYFLGGQYNFEKDREAAERVLKTNPEIPPLAKANRRFLNRIVKWSLDNNVTQFIDVGAGLPTEDAAHLVADRHLHKTARVLYVDNDPIAQAHAQLLLEEGGDGFGALMPGRIPRFGTVNENFYDPKAIFKAAEDKCHMDVSRPVCLFMLALLHFTENPDAVVAQYRDMAPPGSILAISCGYDAATDGLGGLLDVYAESNKPPNLRGREQILSFFGDWDLVEPGLVRLPEWNPDEEETGDDGTVDGAAPILMGGVAIKPAA